MMVDIQTISIAVASASVVAGIVYYALQIRHQSRMRQTDLVVRLYSTFIGKDIQEGYFEVRQLEFVDYDDFMKKYKMPSKSIVSARVNFRYD